MKKGKQIAVIVLGLVLLLTVLYTCNKNEDSGDANDIVTNDSTSVVNQKEVVDGQVEVEKEKEKVEVEGGEGEEEVEQEIAPIKKGSKKKSYYVSPLDGPLHLSGSFGELRNNHFHAGMDLRTGGVQGKSVKAAAGGYISRIKVAGGGYGKALYIQHPNGTTTVYGHLKQYKGAIQDAVIAKQYGLKQYEFDWYVPAGKLKVEKGQVVALSGNTGGSGGPHLHFEIRDKRGHTVNPLLYGLEVQDNIPPFVKSAKLYHLDNSRYESHGIFANGPVNKNGTMSVPPGNYGVGVSWVDYFTDKLNRLGINYAVVKVDGKIVFTQTIEDFAFSQGRYINKHIDYWTYADRGVRYVKMFKDKGNALHFYNGNGIIKVVNQKKV
ncbi:MAG: murein DD-endopeptidase MepM/ murein hydrolase activator NlpD, partial [Bacteroidia bacterium]